MRRKFVLPGLGDSKKTQKENERGISRQCTIIRVRLSYFFATLPVFCFVKRYRREEIEGTVPITGLAPRVAAHDFRAVCVFLFPAMFTHPAGDDPRITDKIRTVRFCKPKMFTAAMQGMILGETTAPTKKAGFLRIKLSTDMTLRYEFCLADGFILHFSKGPVVDPFKFVAPAQ